MINVLLRLIAICHANVSVSVIREKLAGQGKILKKKQKNICIVDP